MKIDRKQDQQYAHFTAEELACIAHVAYKRHFGSAELLLETQAGRFDVLRHAGTGEFDDLGVEAVEILTKKLLELARPSTHQWLTNGSGYMLFPDKSLFITGSGNDEVWIDVGDYVAQCPEWILATLQGDERAMIDWYVRVRAEGSFSFADQGLVNGRQ